MNDPARTRIGVAIDIPEPWGAMLTRRRADAGDPQAAWTPAHVTLLGPTEVDTDALPAVEKHLEAVASAQPPFTIHLRGTGTFRPVTEVVFVSLAVGISECEMLAEAITRSEDIRRDSRFPYHPHVTVAQDVAPEALDAVFDDLAGFSARFPVSSFTLFSHGGEGPWRPRRDFPLGG
ncbi:2'-5' RNA ligase family protein [Actinoplanes teichomyceticus]|uniref:2'-5' RNA ligase n=1 Tax=Actinoplanes teichomyceticus TaxID=1867 RepID=A0A561WPR2_ACTTI|nr:2'-5' RNA ligase family protein [Actinoplanes teichomyceticus]TWG25847.1 2'-5' RNA ligase [Actinoplanes teichomyceticus]GIF10923.1 phosphoesterase [Actinoplanes teichomyceticus]